LILDFDATDCPLYGQQEDRFFHGYYDSYCYLPLYVFCGEQMLAAYLRPSKIDGAKHEEHAPYSALPCEPLAECGDLHDGSACLEQRIAQTRAAGRRDDTNQAGVPCRGGAAWQ
jgi:hypothetical protein